MACVYCMEEPEKGKCIRGECPVCCNCGRIIKVDNSDLNDLLKQATFEAKDHPPLVYMSHTITMAEDNSGRAEEPKEVQRLAGILEKIGVVVFRPLLHNPWNHNLESPIDTEMLLKRSKTILGGYREERAHPLGTFSGDLLGEYTQKYKNKDGKGADYVVDTDISVINRSDFMISLLTPPSIGGAMEMVYACRVGVPIIGILNRKERVSKWAVEHCTHIFEEGALYEENLRSIVRHVNPMWCAKQGEY